jgi:protein TonB
MSRWLRWGILGGVVLIHVVVLLTVTITTRVQEQREDPTVMKMVDVEAFEPPAPPPEPEEPDPPPPEEPPVVTEEPAETVLETEEPVEPAPPPPPVDREPQYLPQHRISKPPEIPTETIRSRVAYPVLANRQGIEGVVYLELFIDETGTVERIEILREPGYGLGEAAAAAFEGVSVVPAEANGRPVAVRFRYPVRFELR